MKRLKLALPHGISSLSVCVFVLCVCIISVTWLSFDEAVEEGERVYGSPPMQTNGHGSYVVIIKLVLFVRVGVEVGMGMRVRVHTCVCVCAFVKKSFVRMSGSLCVYRLYAL